MFAGAKIEGDIEFERASIVGDVVFVRATIEWGALLSGATIKGSAIFTEAVIEAVVYLDYATIETDVTLDSATIYGDVNFIDATIKGDSAFVCATIKGYAWFDGATIEGEALFDFSNIYNLTFLETKFKNMEAQEEACRTARKTQEAKGDRESEDYHYYREMEAKRKQYLHYGRLSRKLRYFIELPVQYVLGYGVKPLRVVTWWLAIIFIFAIVYAIENAVIPAYSPIEYIYFSMLTTATPEYAGYIFAFSNWITSIFGWTMNELEKAFNLPDYLGKCIYFSITSAAILGYGGYTPRTGFEILATLEAIFGTFMWAAFIATVARKYMRA